MACTDLFLSFKDGEISLDTAVADDYVGGQPLKVAAAGASLLKNATPGVSEDSFIGLSKNSRVDDLANGKVTVYGIGSKVKVWDDGNGSPFDLALTYANGEAWGVNAAGLITNVIPANGVKMGTIIKAPASVTDTMELVIKA